MLDTMIARLEAGELIPWHRHGESAELAYVLEGRGRLWQAAGEEDAAVRAETAAALGNTAALGANTAAAFGNPAAVGASPAAGPAAPAGPARAEAREIGPGSAIFIPVGAWHAVENTETSALVIFAVHTDAGGRETSDAP
jgi:quercetin dioxygenase-like cupin family protein